MTWNDSQNIYDNLRSPSSSPTRRFHPHHAWSKSSNGNPSWPWCVDNDLQYAVSTHDSTTCHSNTESNGSVGSDDDAVDTQWQLCSPTASSTAFDVSTAPQVGAVPMVQPNGTVAWVVPMPIQQVQLPHGGLCWQFVALPGSASPVGQSPSDMSCSSTPHVGFFSASPSAYDPGTPSSRAVICDRSANGASENYCDEVSSEMTTLMLRNIPNNHDPEKMQILLDNLGFAGRYDFVYLPRDFRSRAALGYGFVNFTAEVHAKLAYKLLDNFNDWNSNSQKRCEVQWSRTQGFKANVEAVQNSPALRRCLPSNFRPLLLQDGQRIPFPTKDSKLDQEGTLFQNGEHVQHPKKRVGMREKKLIQSHFAASVCMVNMPDDETAYGA